MKILHVYKSFFPEDIGGIAQSIKTLCHGCSKYGLHSEVFALSKTENFYRKEVEGINVTKSSTLVEISSNPFSLDALTDFKRLTSNFDIINYHYPFPFGDILSLYFSENKPSIVTYHSDIVRQKYLKYLYFPVQEKFLNSVNKIICTSENYLHTSTVLERHINKVEAVPLGLIKTNRSFSILSSNPTLSEFNAKPFILFLGVLRNYKGVETLLRASHGLKADLVIAGSGPEHRRMIEYARQNSLEHVKFVGSVTEEEKIFLLNKCRALVLPSHLRSEAFGLVQLEAAMHKKPLICTELGTGTSYVNEHDLTGLVVPPKDVDALRNAMNFMILHPEVASRMGSEAEKRYLKLFTADKMCQEYYRVYCEVLGLHKQ